jgi:FtsP/CotA-like multicopper oxidase with cupredoxin domain
MRSNSGVPHFCRGCLFVAAVWFVTIAPVLTTSYFYPAFNLTGHVHTFTLVVTREFTAGHSRPQITVNHTVPGPTLYAALGDTLRIHVINELNDDATAIHWHGMTMRDTPWMDGVIALTQCPISNVKGNNSLVYEFVPESAGTYWYHGHYHSQYPDGRWVFLCNRHLFFFFVV